MVRPAKLNVVRPAKQNVVRPAKQNVVIPTKQNVVWPAHQNVVTKFRPYERINNYMLYFISGFGFTRSPNSLLP